MGKGFVQMTSRCSCWICWALSGDAENCSQKVWSEKITFPFLLTNVVKKSSSNGGNKTITSAHIKSYGPLCLSWQ